MTRVARFFAAALAAAFVAASSVGLDAQARPAPRSAEAAAARRFSAIRKDPELLQVFLRDMPKGGDLHNHLSGAIYAESYLRWAAADGLCLATATLALVQPPCEATGRPAASAVIANSALYNQTIDAWSMRWWNPARNGHDHFFAAFGLFGAEASKTGDMVAEVASRAAAEHVSYLELMLTPDGGAASELGRATGWDADLGRLRDKLLAAGFGTVVSTARRRLDAAEAREREVLGCGQAEPDPGCDVTIRYISQVSRAAAREQVFAQMLAGFELTAADPRVVGLNLVQPEDAPTALDDFHLQMTMLDFLHGRYPRVKIALHAGELTDGLVPPEDLRDHIRQSIDVGHASRIGHGVDVMSEDHPIALLREMAAQRVLVEVALSSNDLILGVRGARHPLATYLRFGVPTALVTDDAGVSRSSLTLEFRKAVEEQGIGYLALKQMARNSIAYAFADVVTKAKLLGELDTAFDAFERHEQAIAIPGLAR